MKNEEEKKEEARKNTALKNDRSTDPLNYSTHPSVQEV